MIPGVTIAMGGRDWLVPPLTLGQLRRLMPKVRQLTEIGATMGEVQIGVLVEIVASALQRNYPDATADVVENLLDLGNASIVLNAVLTGSGLKLHDDRLGEVSAPGTGPGADSTSTTLDRGQDRITGARTAGDRSTASSPLPAATATP
jgi:hypothetical protein